MTLDESYKDKHKEKLPALNKFAKNSEYAVSSLLPQWLSTSFSRLRSWATNAMRETRIKVT